MGQVHDLLTARGKQAALDGGHSRDIVEAAASYMGDEASGIGFLYSGWCQSGLPHKRLPDGQDWQIKTDQISLLVEAGARIGLGNKPIPLGVPFGSRARLILIFLQSEALRTSSREVELGRSLRKWFGKMGIPSAGKNIAAVRDQAERISRCRLTFEHRNGKRLGMTNLSIVESALFVEDDDRQEGLFAETVMLSDGFFQQLKKHPVPLEEAALKAISNNSMAIDAYCWLAYRLHSLAAPTPVSWPALKPQFGAGVKQMNDFRAKFLPNLELALSVYPAAKVELTDTGLLLHPSRPPVAPKLVAVC